jgi:hypothetical protein
MRSSPAVSFPALAILFFVSLAPAAAQQADSGLFDVHGKVVNALTGEPVGGALLQIPGQAATFSDSEGNFALTSLARGHYVLAGREPGFFGEQELGRAIPLDKSTIEVPSDLPVVIKLTPEAVIYGEVKNAEGEPLEDVAVRAERWQTMDGRRQLQVAKETRTDDEGNFRLAELVPGKYYLQFLPGERSGVTRGKQAQDEGYGPQFYPGVADAAAASAFQVRAGSQVHVAHSFLRQQVFRVSGVVRGVSADGFFNIELTNSSGEPVNRNIRVDRKTGEFHISGIPAGNYLLTAMQFPNGMPLGPPPSASKPIRVAGDVSDIVLALGTGISLGVQLRDEISASEEPHRVYLRLRLKDFIRNEQGFIVPPMPDDPRPVTRFENLSPGIYSVEVQGMASKAYIAELRCGNVDLLRDDLVIAPGAAPPPIDVTLREDGANLTVKLKNAGNRATPLLVYSPDYPRRSLLAQLPDSASISIPNLPPGSYQVIALTDANDLEFRNPAAIQKYLGRATSVTLQPHDNITISVETAAVEEQRE